MVKRCGEAGCIKRPSYGLDGSKEPEFCVAHARHGMTSLKKVKKNKRCAHPAGCPKQPNYGVDGSKRPEFCATHAGEGMVNVLTRCGSQGCTKYPSYGIQGSGKREFCSEH
ncbi:unnamed protein product, partial [Hapterophycus canaliculatus]